MYMYTYAYIHIHIYMCIYICVYGNTHWKTTRTHTTHTPNRTQSNTHIMTMCPHLHTRQHTLHVHAQSTTHTAWLHLHFLKFTCFRSLIHSWRDSFICDMSRYGVATMSRLLKIIGVFCKRALQKRLYSAKETYSFKEPTNHSHPIRDRHLEGCKT